MANSTKVLSVAAADDSRVAQRFQLDPDAPEPLHEQIADSSPPADRQR